MMGQSNDWFYGPGESGIELFTDGKPISGDISSQIILWDVGTEVDQEPGIGTDQGPRQKAPNTGKAENGVVRKIEDGKAYSKASDVMRGYHQAGALKLLRLSKSYRSGCTHQDRSPTDFLPDAIS
jgi:hypothetical protein